MAFKVLNPNPLSSEAEQLLNEHGIEVIRLSGPEKSDIIKDISDVDALVVWKSPNYTIDSEIIDAGKNLKLIARFGVGMEIVDVAYAKEKGIVVTNTPTSNSNAVAELAIYLLIASAKNAHLVDRRFRGGEFKTIWKTNAVELEGKTLGIIGPGHIGQLVAKKAKYGFGMKVLGYNPHPNAVFIEEIEKADSLEVLLTQSDFVSIHVPATDETVGMIGAEQFKLMKNTAFLINTARGQIVKEDALIEALQQGVIAGAGLDVFTQEPPAKDNPLFTLDNVVVTPHYGGFTDAAVAKTGIQVAESIIAVSEGREPAFKL